MGKELLFMGWYAESSSLNFKVSPDKEKVSSHGRDVGRQFVLLS